MCELAVNWNDELTPREIVSELDRYVVGQRDAKRAVAIALRNRWRRQQVSDELRDEIVPKNIIMIGATGVGKTEIARRLAKLARAPFIKVEASKFTEVGYVGRDVESIIRDLVESSVAMVKSEERSNVRTKAEERAEECMLDALFPASGMVGSPLPEGGDTREKMRKLLREGKLEDRDVEIEVHDSGGIAGLSIMTPMVGAEDMGAQIRDMLGGLLPKRSKRRRMKVSAARQIFEAEETERLVDMESVRERAVERTEQAGIVFIDELDKVAVRSGEGHGPDVSREGVQRDLLPIVEGSTVQTKYGPVNTDHILFIAAGAFHVAKPSDLIPELQGRFPIRVELTKLGRDDFIRILKEPRNSLVRQYTALLETEGMSLNFTDDGIAAIADIAAGVNERTENIGARRLHTILEKLLEDESFAAPDLHGTHVTVNAQFVRARLENLAQDDDLSRFIL